MNVGILGYGKEGQSSEKYFTSKGHEVGVFDNFKPSDLDQINFEGYDLILRSPSVHPRPNFSSATRYFFDHCPCPIIGVTGTKGKGTTCSMIAALLQNLGEKIWLVGNIGTPALDVLDDITPKDIVVYEMSSFQLWDLHKAPHISVVLRIEPDHLNIHDDYDDYVNAKANIAKHQSPDDYCIYYQNNPDSTKVAKQSPGQKLAYPVNDELVEQTVAQLTIPGLYNRENAEAALLAVASWYDMSVDDFIKKHQSIINQTLHDFKGLPHRFQYLRELNGVKYYDDNFSSSFPSLDVALTTFTDQPIVLIAGGQDRGLDLTPTKKRIFSLPNLQKVFLIGETKTKLAADEDPDRYELCDSLGEAFTKAVSAAESCEKPAILLMSPGAPSFDMFKNFVDRGEQFQKLVQELK